MYSKTLTAGVLALAIVGGAAATAHADTPPVLHPVASPMEDQAAEQEFATQFGIATSLGGFGGMTLGAIIGCAAGGLVTAPTVVFVPAGCLTGAVTGAGVGGIVGTIVVGGPTLIVSGANLIAALAAAPGTTPRARR